MIDTPGQINLFLGWIGIMLGIVSGFLLGLRFHEHRWIGGYGSFARRMIRLGHISFFGLGFVNILFALSLARVTIPAGLLPIAENGFALGAVTMPMCCFLTSWKTSFRWLFPVPILSLAAGVTCTLLGSFAS
jgi:hypothetical protein